MSTWDAVITSAPVNRTAQAVIAKPRAPQSMGDIGRADLIALIARLQRKLRLLKVVLKIDTKAKHRNLVYKTGRGMRTYRGAANSRAVTEYLQIGHEIQRMNRTLQEMKAAKSGKPVVQGGWKP